MNDKKNVHFRYILRILLFIIFRVATTLKLLTCTISN